MTKVENFVRSLPEFAAKAETNLDKTRIQQSRLSQYGEDTFRDYDKLLDTTAKRDALQETLAKVDQSAGAEEERQRRAQRLALKGRTKGWSLRLNPTKAYAEKVEFTNVDDLIFQVKNEELEAMFHNSVIDESTYLDRKRVLAGVPIEATNREAAPKEDSNHLGAEEFNPEGHSYAPETMTPAERLSLQTTRSQDNQTIVEHDKSTENEVAAAGQAEL